MSTINNMFDTLPKRKFDDNIQDNSEFGKPNYIRFVVCNSERFYVDQDIIKKYSPVLTAMIENSKFSEGESAKKNQDIYLECPFQHNNDQKNSDDEHKLIDNDTQCVFITGFCHLLKLLKKHYYGNWLTYSDLKCIESTVILSKIANLYMVSVVTEHCIDFLNHKLGSSNKVSHSSTSLLDLEKKDCISSESFEAIIQLMEIFPEFSKLIKNLCSYINHHSVSSHCCNKDDKCISKWVSACCKYPKIGTTIIENIHFTNVKNITKLSTTVNSIEGKFIRFIKNNHDDEDDDGNKVDEDSITSQIECISDNISKHSDLIPFLTDVYEILHKV